MLSDLLSNIFKRKPASPVATDDAMDIGITPKPLESPIADAGQLPLPADNPQAAVNAAPVVPTFINQGNWRAARAPEKNVQSEFNAHMANPNTPTDWSRSEDPYAKDRYDAVTNGGTALPHRSWKEALKNIAAGALQGAATGAAYGNPLGGLLGGAAAGGIGGTISPVAGAESRFNAFQLPRLLQNRQLAQEQALNSAKVNAENQKAAQEAATAQQRGLIKTDNGLYDARRGAIIPGTAQDRENELRVIPSNAILARGTNPVLTNAQQRPSGTVLKAVKNVNGHPKTMLSTDPDFNKYDDYEKPQASGLPPSQRVAEANRDATAQDAYDKQEAEFKDAMGAFEAAKQDAMSRGVAGNKLKDDEDVKNALSYLKQNYPRRVKIGYEQGTGSPWIKEDTQGRPQAPARLRNKAGSASNVNSLADKIAPRKFSSLPQ